jgi:hypothetical protein
MHRQANDENALGRRHLGSVFFGHALVDQTFGAADRWKTSTLLHILVSNRSAFGVWRERSRLGLLITSEVEFGHEIPSPAITNQRLLAQSLNASDVPLAHRLQIHPQLGVRLRLCVSWIAPRQRNSEGSR